MTTEAEIGVVPGAGRTGGRGGLFPRAFRECGAAGMCSGASGFQNRESRFLLLQSPGLWCLLQQPRGANTGSCQGSGAFQAGPLFPYCPECFSTGPLCMNLHLK